MSRVAARLASAFAWGSAFLLPFPRTALADGADAPEVAARAVEQWRAAGADATLLPSRFVFDEQSILVALPAPPAGERGACTHVALVGVRGLGFHAKFTDASNDPLAPEPLARANSVAGVLELKRCDANRAPRHVLLSSDSGRGAIEMVVAHAAPGLPSLTSVVPERTGGALPEAPEAGMLPPLVSPEKRAEVAEARAKRDGAQVRPRSLLRAGDDGSGEDEIDLPAGCHRVELFAKDPRTEQPTRRFRLDIDAELRDPETDRIIARDRTEAPDARLETCLGRPTRLSVVFVGAVPRSEVTATITSWSLPGRLPALWGAVPRAKMARAMFTRHVAIPADDPIFLGQGTSGTTSFPMPVEVGGCYVVVVGVTHGQARSLQLRALVGARESTDERGAAEEAALTAFCVGAHERARVEVHARGPAMGWGLAVYRVKSGIWEAGR